MQRIRDLGTLSTTGDVSVRSPVPLHLGNYAYKNPERVSELEGMEGIKKIRSFKYTRAKHISTHRD